MMMLKCCTQYASKFVLQLLLLLLLLFLIYLVYWRILALQNSAVFCQTSAWIWKTQQWPQDWKRSIFIPISNKGNAKECSHYHIIVLISQASKVMVKILQTRLQQYVNWELSDIQAGLRKGRGTGDQTANIRS